MSWRQFGTDYNPQDADSRPQANIHIRVNFFIYLFVCLCFTSGGHYLKKCLEEDNKTQSLKKSSLKFTEFINLSCAASALAAAWLFGKRVLCCGTAARSVNFNAARLFVYVPEDSGAFP